MYNKQYLTIRRTRKMAKRYSEEFKNDAVQYKLSHPELTIEQAAKNLKISKSGLDKWLRSSKQNNGVVAHRGSGNYSSDEAKEIARLKRELKAKDDALNILKKAIGILGEEEPK